MSVSRVWRSLIRGRISTILVCSRNQWTGFTKHFTDLKAADAAKDRTPLMTTILGDAINSRLISRLAQEWAMSSGSRAARFQTNSFSLRESTCRIFLTFK